MSMKPPLPAVGTCFIQLFGPPADTTNAAKWDEARWDQDVWSGYGWQDVTPQSLNVQISWGTDDNMGALSVSAAGSWQVYTYDPDRLLDPSNYNSPFYPFLRPGGLVRVSYSDGFLNDETVRVGFIDEIEFNIADKTGSIRASDGISLMAKAKTPAGMAHNPATPVTLRAFARYILQQAKVRYIEVEPDPPAPNYDPSIGLAIEEEASAWQQISAAALDALHALWLDREGVLHFRYFGKPQDRNIHVGGDTGIPIDNVTPHLSLEGVFNHAIARYFSFEEKWADVIGDQNSVDLYGDLLLKRDFPNPNAQEWAEQMMQDRKSASVQYDIGTLRPRTRDELASILTLGMADMIGLHVTKHGNPINRDVIVLGGTVEANVDSGWSAKLTTYEPSQGWWNQDADRLYQKKAVATLTVNTTYDRTTGSVGDGGVTPIQELQANYDPQFGTPSVQTVRQIQVKFDPIDFTDMASVYDARLRWFLPKHEDATEDELARRLGHIDQIYVKQIVGAWDASSDGSTIGTVEEGKAWADYEQGVWIEWPILDLVKAWFDGTRLQEDGLLLKPYPFETDVVDATLHGLFAGAKSDTPPYILVLYKHV